MSENCTHDCSSYGENYSSRTVDQISFLEPLSPASSVKRVIGIVSGKGGVSKFLVTSLLTVKSNSPGHKTTILDADITGPSTPKSFGTGDDAGMTPDGLMVPVVSSTGIEIMSANLLLDNDTDPVIWRGPVIADAVKQFWNETLQQDIDYMLANTSPGTGDVPLTVFQSPPMDGIIIVTSPQELVSMIVTKTVNMVKEMDILISGLMENMSWLECPDCGKKISIFGESHIDETAAKFGLPVLAKLLVNPFMAEEMDSGTVEYAENDRMGEAVKVMEAL